MTGRRIREAGLVAVLLTASAAWGQAPVIFGFPPEAQFAVRRSGTQAVSPLDIPHDGRLRSSIHHRGDRHVGF